MKPEDTFLLSGRRKRKCNEYQRCSDIKFQEEQTSSNMHMLALVPDLVQAGFKPSFIIVC